MTKQSIPEVDDPISAPETQGIVLTKAAGVYDFLSPPMMFWQEQVINRRAAKLLAPKDSDKVLDIGSATGFMTLAIADYLDKDAGGLAVGVDASMQMVEVARKKINGRPLRFDIGLAEALPYPDACFDAVVSTFFFHHLNLEDKLKSLLEAQRVLRSGGTCIIADLDVPTNIMGRISGFGAARLFNQPEITENIEGKLVPLFEKAGFSQLERLAHNLGYITTFKMIKG